MTYFDKEEHRKKLQTSLNKDVTAESFKPFLMGFSSTVNENAKKIFELCKQYHQAELLKYKLNGSESNRK